MAKGYYNMPPKAKYTREEIIEIAFQMARENGIESVVARELGKRWGLHRLRFSLLLKTWKSSS